MSKYRLELGARSLQYSLDMLTANEAQRSTANRTKWPRDIIQAQSGYFQPLLHKVTLSHNVPHFLFMKTRFPLNWSAGESFFLLYFKVDRSVKSSGQER